MRGSLCVYPINYFSFILNKAAFKAAILPFLAQIKYTSFFHGDKWWTEKKEKGRSAALTIKVKTHLCFKGLRTK